MMRQDARNRLSYPSGGVQVLSRVPAAAATPRWRSGGISSGDCVAAYEAKGAASQAASYVNLHNPGTFDLTVGSAPTWDAATGWTFAGAEWLDSNIFVNNASMSYIVRFSDAASGVYTMIGTDTNRLMPNRNNNVYYGVTTKSPGLTNGVLAIAGTTGYRNGVSEGVVSIGAGGIPGRTHFIGAQNEGSATAKWIGKIQAVYFYSIILTADQVAALTTAMNTI